MDKKGKIQNIVSLLITLLVVGVYLIPNLTEAVSLSVSTDKAVYLPADNTIQSDLSINIRENERIPIQDISLLLDGNEICKFDADGSVISGCAGISITQTSPGNYGEGTFLEGTDEATGQFTSFGYGYGQNGYTGILSYNIMADKPSLSLAEGTHAFQLSANAVGTLDSHIYSTQTSFDVLINVPDLKISSLRLYYPQNPTTTSGTMYAFTVENIGNTAADNILWRLNTGENTIDSGYSFSLQPGENTFVYTTPYTYTSSGAKTVTAIADYNNVITEASEANNQQSISVSVS